MRLAENPTLNLRYQRTLQFMKEIVPPPARVFDLGAANPFSSIMEREGYQVENIAAGIDLDLQPEVVRGIEADVITAFEIFEHLVAPFNVLRL